MDQGSVPLIKANARRALEVLDHVRQDDWLSPRARCTLEEFDAEVEAWATDCGGHVGLAVEQWAAHYGSAVHVEVSNTSEKYLSSVQLSVDLPTGVWLAHELRDDWRSVFPWPPGSLVLSGGEPDVGGYTPSTADPFARRSSMTWAVGDLPGLTSFKSPGLTLYTEDDHPEGVTIFWRLTSASFDTVFTGKLHATASHVSEPNPDTAHEALIQYFT